MCELDHLWRFSIFLLSLQTDTVCLTAHHQLNISAMECVQSRSGHVALGLSLGCRSFLNTVLIRCNSWCIEAKQGKLSAIIKHSLWVCPLAICCWIICAIICYYTRINYKINTNSHKWGMERVTNIALYEFILIIPQFKLVLHVWITILVRCEGLMSAQLNLGSLLITICDTMRTVR